MKIKKFIADSMPEAMKLIRKELGSDAIILQSKEVKSGRFFGLFKKKQLEVVAALDPNPVPERKPVPEVVQRKNLVKQQSEKLNPSESQHEVLGEIKKLKEIIELQNEKMKEDLPLNYQIIEKHLREQEVESELIDQLLTETRNNLSEEAVPTVEGIFAELQSIIKRDITPYVSSGISTEKQIIQFVGPTGVGKTTTIAKIAAELLLKKEKKVAFITMDTYRIAAIEQLKTYAKILNVPIEVVYNIDDYEKALKKLSAYDYIMVDTAGRNFRDTKYINELKEMMGNFDDIATYLVLSLTAKPKDVIDIYEQFQTVPLSGTIFTKLDETTQYGSLLNIVLARKLKLVHITNGQDVPDDLLTVTAADISKLIVGEKDG